jgi:hypothetical protein
VSFEPLSAAAPEPAAAGFGASVFEYQLRRDGRLVATIRGVQTPSGFTVVTDVHPTTGRPDDPPIHRPYAFQTLEHARRFADEALVAFEYLNCTVV